MSFGSRFDVTRRAFGPLCVGVDPHPEILEQWGLEDTVDGLASFAETCVNAFAGRVGFIKPQAAFFERFGSRGIMVLEDLLIESRHTGSLVILDVKRGDIGSTARAYAQAYVDEDSPLAADAITVNPFLGTGTLEPFFRYADISDAGVFVLALTSNPEGSQVQHAVSGDKTVSELLLDDLRRRNAHARPLGSAGAVIGATGGSDAHSMDFNGPVLVPGLGVQGGEAHDIKRAFGSSYDAVIASASRAILQSGPRVADLRAAAARFGELLMDP